MPPVNDNRANATALPNDGSGSVTGSNVGATTEAGEGTILGGKTVWWKWNAPAAGVYRFGTRGRQGLGIYGTGTNFPTSIAIFDSQGGLVKLGDRYANWWEQSEVTFTVTAAQAAYLIRVGSLTGLGGPQSNGEGNIFLWWEQADNAKTDITINGCGECLGAPSGTMLVMCIAPDTTAPRDIVLDASQSTIGWYLAEYCGGAWNFIAEGVTGYGWVVDRIPVGIDQLWGGLNPTGHWFWMEGTKGYYDEVRGGPMPVFNEAQSNNATTPQLAMQKARCIYIRFFHDGSGLLHFRFEDEKYTDNFPVADIGGPVFDILRADPVSAVAIQSRITRVSSGSYQAQFKIQNASVIDWNYISAKMTGASVGTSNEVVAPGLDAPFLAGQFWTVLFNFTLTPSGTLSPAAAVSLFVNAPPRPNATTPIKRTQFADIAFDFTPNVVVTPDFSKITKINNRWFTGFNFASGGSAGVNGLPTIDLHAIFENSGGVSQLRDVTDNTLKTDFPVNSSGRAVLEFVPTPVGVTQVTFTIHLRDNSAGLDLPPQQFTMPCPL